MKKVLKFSVFLMLVGTSIAQNDSIKDRECKRMRFLAGEELKVKNYSGAVTYYLKGENICGDYDKGAYKRVATTIKNTIKTTKDKNTKKLYADTLLSLMDRMETKWRPDARDTAVNTAGLQGGAHHEVGGEPVRQPERPQFRPG